MKKLTMQSLFIFLIQFLIIIDSYAYDWDKCRRAWMYTPVYGIVAVSTMSPIQFISSWGACSAIGEPEHSKEAFFNDNYNLVRRNFALNYGEFRDAFLDLFACNDEGKEELNNKIRSNFELIFASHSTNRLIDDESIEINFNKLMSVVNSDSIIQNNCKFMK